jgi:hypothetical protein
MEGALVRLSGQNLRARLYWPFSNDQLPLSLPQRGQDLPLIVQLSAAAAAPDNVSIADRASSLMAAVAEDGIGVPVG